MKAARFRLARSIPVASHGSETAGKGFLASGQLVGTVALLAWVPTNVGKVLALLTWWAITFRRVSLREGALYLGGCVLFSAMNVAALSKGLFQFSRPDLLGMPIYEFFMWGFYLLHLHRFTGGRVPSTHPVIAWGMCAALALPFLTLEDPSRLTLVSGLALLGSLSIFHDPEDLACAGYAVILGAVVEYVGVYRGLWSYPQGPETVPIWFASMWGSVGIGLRRAILPMMRPNDS